MAVFPFPQLAELREKYTYNITPFPTSVRSNGRFVSSLAANFNCDGGVIFTNSFFLSRQRRSGQLGERRRRRHGRRGLGGDGAGLPGASRRAAGPRAAEIPETSERLENFILAAPNPPSSALHLTPATKRL